MGINMKLITMLLVLTCGVDTFLLVEANKAIDAQEYYLEQEVQAAYQYACVGSGTNKTIIECGMEAIDYTEEYLPKK
jgi:hypothetical protein